MDQTFQTDNRKCLPNYIIWDIDGVFNPHMATDLRERQFIRFNKDWVSWDLDIVHHAAWVRELEDYADLIWGSTWGEESNALAGWFHLQKTGYPHIPVPGGGSMLVTAKLPAISQWIEQNVSSQQKVVWVDDELFSDAFDWAAQKPNVLIIHTDAAVGLTLEQVDRMKAFLS